MEAPKIFSTILAVMNDIDAISKGRRNSQQGYNFRGIDDVYNELHASFAKHGLFTVSELLWERSEDRTSGKGNALIYRVLCMRYTFWAADGSSVQSTVIGEGMDSGDKASNKAMAVAHKYALMQVFCIPTEDAKDPENDSHTLAAKPRAQASAAQFSEGNGEVIIFAGTDEQKRYLGEIFRKHKVESVDEMKKIAGKAIVAKVPMGDLETFVIKEL